MKHARSAAQSRNGTGHDRLRTVGARPRLAAAAQHAPSLVPATCGEFVQGPYRGHLLQITCPVDLYVRATARLEERPPWPPERGGLAAEGGELVEPAGGASAVRRFRKARCAADEALRRWGPAGSRLTLSLRSPVPRGKGMGSSTADIVAGLAATARACGHRAGPDELATSALAVEPSDGTMLPGIALFDHRRGRVREPVAAAPPLRILVVDLGGTVDTVAFNLSPHRSRRWRRSRRRWARAFRLVLHGLRTGDLEAIGRGSTLSAQLHRPLVPRPHLSFLLRTVRETGGLGVNVAHSGTVVGLLFADDGTSLDDVRFRLRTRFPGVSCRGVHRVVDGGVRRGSPQEPGIAPGRCVP